MAFIHTAACLLILCSISSAQFRGDSDGSCSPNDGFGKYCPTTCGVADTCKNQA
uniref:Uncharacterized protein n=1 Tax=Anguilla anguilla TaxID=7936 RepID=A0A0E9VFE6_ANGAN